jgi:hypothetical protein
VLVVLAIVGITNSPKRLFAIILGGGILLLAFYGLRETATLKVDAAVPGRVVFPRRCDLRRTRIHSLFEGMVRGFPAPYVRPIERSFLSNSGILRDRLGGPAEF